MVKGGRVKLGSPLLAMPLVVDTEGVPGPEVDDWEPRSLATLLIVAGKETPKREVGVWGGLVIGACIEVGTEKVFALEVSKLLLLAGGRRLAAVAVLLTASQSPVPIRTVTTDGAIVTGRVRVP
jgi:hypothetical protein